MIDLAHRNVLAGDVDGRRLAARIFGELGLAAGALAIPRFEAELAIVMALDHGARLESAHRSIQRRCRVCGCGELTACRGPDGPCGWAGADLCTVCAAYPAPAS
jgi:hypothetical protein